MFNEMTGVLYKADSYKDPTRKCMVCERLEDPTSFVVNIDKPWLCDGCKTALKKLVTKEDAE